MVGVQATFGQLPPQRSFSTSATRAPYLREAVLAASRAARSRRRARRGRNGRASGHCLASGAFRYSRRVASEAERLDALRAGDEEAFTALVREYHASLVRVARMYVSTLAAAEEVAQETWLAALNGLSRFEGRSSLKTWIFRILTNIAKTQGGARRPDAAVLGAAGPRARVPEAAVDADRFLDPEHPRWPGHWARSRGPGPRRRWSRLRRGSAWPRRSRRCRRRSGRSSRCATSRAGSSEEVRNALDLSETNQRVLLHRARSKVRAALESYLEHA